MTTKRSVSSHEIVLENRQLVFIFFGAVLLCAIFFTLGFFVGREQRDLAIQSGPLKLEAEAAPPPGKTAPKKEPAAVSTSSKTSDQEAINKELTFYKTVEGKSDASSLKMNQAPTAASEVKKAAAENSSPPPSSSAPKVASPAAVHPSPATIVYQVAALSKSVEAEALVRKLKEKGFPAFLVSPPPDSTVDKLYRVQVGPFAAADTADQVKAKLIANGYTPITRK